MGKVGSSVRNTFPFATWQDAVAHLVRYLPDADLVVTRDDEGLVVLIGDQILFEAASESECQDFIIGAVVGAALFGDLAALERAEWNSMNGPAPN
jgi:hypothetical protein